MKKLILSGVVILSSVSAFADERSTLIQSELLLPSSSLGKFDGHDFGMSEAQLKKDLANYGKVEVSLKDRMVQTTNGKVQYRMNWKNEDFENGLDLRLNQVSAIKKYNDTTKKTENEITLTTNTFNGKYLRSSTICSGGVVNSDGVKDATGSDKEVYCATATKEVCKRVLDAYKRNDKLRTPGVSGQESKKAADAKVESCLKTMDGYAEVLRAFSKTYTGNAGVQANHQTIIDREKKEIDNVLKDVKSGSGWWKSNHINTMTGDDFEKTANKLTSTMSGLKQVNDFVDVCNSHESDFAPDATVGGSSGVSATGTNRR